MFSSENNFQPFESKVWLSSPTMYSDSMKYVMEAYETNWMSTVGANINEVERLACEKVGCKYAVALSAGTAALHMAVKLAGVKPGDKVFCSDMTFDAMHDKEYIQQLIDICVADKIDVLIPTIDTDLLILSKNTEKFDKVGTKVLISKSDKILICRDKNNTGEFFESCGLKAPRTYNNYKNYPGPYPCFIKPKDGSSCS